MKKIVTLILILCFLFSFTSIVVGEKQTGNVGLLEVFNSYIQSSSIDKSEFVPGELIVKFKEKPTISSSPNGILTTGIESVDVLNMKYGVSSAKKILKDESNSILSNIYKFTVASDADVSYIAEKYNEDSSVEFAEPNYIISLDTPHEMYASVKTAFASNSSIDINDPMINNQWGLYKYTSNRAGIDAMGAWKKEIGDPSVTIAIIDTGIDYNHPDLAENIWSNAGEIPNNGIDDDNNDFVDDVMGWDFYNNDNNPIDDFGHGTLCAGIASAVTNNSIGIAGVGWNCKIMSLKAIGADGEGNAVSFSSAIIYAADNGAKVISMSWGGPQLIIKPKLEQYALDYAYDKDVTLVAAAGNSGLPLVWYPARDEHVIGVGATNMAGEYCPWSNYGDGIDLAAPGESILSTMPTYNVTLNDLLGYSMNYEDNTLGTSMATPYVAGVAALIISYCLHNNLTNNNVADILYRAARDLGHPDIYGHGLVDAKNALDNVIPPTGDYNFQVESNSQSVKSQQSSDDQNSEGISEIIDSNIFKQLSKIFSYSLIENSMKLVLLNKLLSFGTTQQNKEITYTSDKSDSNDASKTTETPDTHNDTSSKTSISDTSSVNIVVSTTTTSSSTSQQTSSKSTIQVSEGTVKSTITSNK
jgi:subtilisin family serine protease